jgi:hypothetical protein
MYVATAQVIINFLAPKIGIYCAMTMLFINERTFRFDKFTEYIPQRHFVNGIVSQHDEVITLGIAMSLTKLRETLSSLESQWQLIYSSAPHKDRPWMGKCYGIDVESLYAITLDDDDFTWRSMESFNFAIDRWFEAHGPQSLRDSRGNL